jgi:hypothetical protein
VLRVAVLMLGALSLLGGVYFLPRDADTAHWLLWQGGILVVLIVFERWRYRPRHYGAAGGWQPTGEKFVDPASGKLTAVYYNPETGERDYRVQGEGP